MSEFQLKYNHSSSLAGPTMEKPDKNGKPEQMYLPPLTPYFIIARAILALMQKSGYDNQRKAGVNVCQGG